jgi:hypothetical protein
LTARFARADNRRRQIMALGGFRIIDADGHVTEPASLYVTHIDSRFRAQAEALTKSVGAGNLGIIPALYPEWRSAARPLGEAEENPMLTKFPSGRNHPLASPAGGYDPHERIRDMDREGIDVACVSRPSPHRSARRAILISKRRSRMRTIDGSVSTAQPIRKESRAWESCRSATCGDAPPKSNG